MSEEKEKMTLSSFTGLSRDELKVVIKEAISEWLDIKYMEFGKWTIHGIMAALLGYLVLFFIHHWSK